MGIRVTVEYEHGNHRKRQVRGELVREDMMTGEITLRDAKDVRTGISSGTGFRVFTGRIVHERGRAA